jgi:hypothetical protein
VVVEVCFSGDFVGKSSLITGVLLTAVSDLSSLVGASDFFPSETTSLGLASFLGLVAASLINALGTFDSGASVFGGFAFEASELGVSVFGSSVFGISIFDVPQLALVEMDVDLLLLRGMCGTRVSSV